MKTENVISLVVGIAVVGGIGYNLYKKTKEKALLAGGANPDGNPNDTSHSALGREMASTKITMFQPANAVGFGGWGSNTIIDNSNKAQFARLLNGAAKTNKKAAINILQKNGWKVFEGNIDSVINDITRAVENFNMNSKVQSKDVADKIKAANKLSELLTLGYFNASGMRSDIFSPRVNVAPSLKTASTRNSIFQPGGANPTPSGKVRWVEGGIIYEGSKDHKTKKAIGEA